jgi:archaellum component FlaG (FlaF/FlaG flagellin family)
MSEAVWMPFVATTVIAAAAATLVATIAAALAGGLRRRAHERHERRDVWRWEVVPASRRWI